MWRVLSIVLLAAVCSACGSSTSTTAPSVPTVTAPAGSVTETFAGTISGGDATSCVYGGVPPFVITSAPCNVHTITVSTTAGTLTASVAFNRNQSLLQFGIYDPVAHNTFATGNLDTSGFPNYTENLSTNVQPGTYQLQVSVISSSAITPYTVTVTHPR